MHKKQVVKMNTIWNLSISGNVTEVWLTLSYVISYILLYLKAQVENEDPIVLGAVQMKTNSKTEFCCRSPRMYICGF